MWERFSTTQRFGHCCSPIPPSSQFTSSFSASVTVCCCASALQRRSFLSKKPRVRRSCSRCSSSTGFYHTQRQAVRLCRCLAAIAFGTMNPWPNTSHERPQIRLPPVAEEPRLHRGGRAHARARHRREHGHIQCDRRGVVENAPGQKSRTIG